MEQAASIQPSSNEQDIRQVWDGRREGHYEVWYLTLNHLASQTGYWIRYTMEAPLTGHGEPEARLWFASFDARHPERNFAINRPFPITQLATTASPYEVRIGESTLSHGRARGALSGEGHEVRWNLQWDPGPTTHRHLPSFAYKTKIPDTVVLSPSVDAAIHGELVVDGATLRLEGDPGGQTHLWGRKHAHAWAWGHCNAFRNQPGAALEALTVRLKRRGLVTPPLTMVTLYTGIERYRFAELSDLVRTRGHLGRARYAFEARGHGVKMEGEFRCQPEDMILAQYTDPDGEPSWCANTEVADLYVRLWKRFGTKWEEQSPLYALQTAHFEVAGRERDPAIARLHVEI